MAPEIFTAFQINFSLWHRDEMVKITDISEELADSFFGVDTVQNQTYSAGNSYHVPTAQHVT
jgi:hypothetical protein